MNRKSIMKKVLMLVLVTFFLGAFTMEYPEVIPVVDYAKYEYFNGPERGDDYYIGNIYLDNKEKKIWFVPVKTEENVGVGTIKKAWQKIISQKPRLYIDKESFYIARKLKEFELNGIEIKDAKHRKKLIKIGDKDFPSALKSYISKVWGVVNQPTGEKYLKNGWSRTKEKELAQNREYYNFEYPFQKMTEKQYNAHFIKVNGIMK